MGVSVAELYFKNMNEFIETRRKQNILGKKMIREVIPKKIIFEHSEISISTTDCLQSERISPIYIDIPSHRECSRQFIQFVLKINTDTYTFLEEKVYNVIHIHTHS